MSGPEQTGFDERLRATLAGARATGRVAVRDYEALLVAPDFDDEAFERFRTAALRARIALPEDDEEPRPADLRPGGGEPERDLLDLYLNEIGRIPMLAHPDLLAAVRRAHAGEARSRERVVLANLRLVVHLARAYRGRGLPMLDLIEEGNLGLIHAVDRFDPERGLRFSTYAAIWIRQSMLRGIAEQARAVRIPVQMLHRVNRFVRAERDLRARLGRDPEIAEIAAALEMSPERTERLAGLLQGLRSLDEGSSMAAYEALSTEDLSEPPLSVERLVELQLEHEHVDRLLRTLGQREEQVLRIRYGFLDGVARTLQQTGEHFGITRERVRQIEAGALAKLRRALELEAMDRSAGEAVQ